MFDVLKITRTEIRHSSVLAWLMDPAENHGLRDAVMRGFVDFAACSMGAAAAFDDLLMDCNDFSVLREWSNIDILAINDQEKYVLCIENKINSAEHGNQLAKYRVETMRCYAGYRHRFVLLPPDATEPSDTENWIAMGYSDVLEIVERAVDATELAPGPALLIENYMETIRRNVLGDEELARVCAEIYAKHRRALDLIFEKRPDKLSEVSTLCREWAECKTSEGLHALVPDKCGKTYTRFTTARLSSILPDTEGPSSGWGTRNHYFCEIVALDGGDKLKCQVSFNFDGPDAKRMRICDTVNQLYPSKISKAQWKWRTQWSTKAIAVPDDFDGEWIDKKLDTMFASLQKFEKELTSKLETQHRLSK